MSENTGSISDGYHTFDELYEHRHALMFNLMAERNDTKRAWISLKHYDGSKMEGWFIAGVQLWTGKTITYHMPDRLWEKASKCAKVLPNAPKWDGHTSLDVVKRLMEAV